jgi:hypothetical protein
MRHPGAAEETEPWTDMRRPGPGTVDEAASRTDMPALVQLKKPDLGRVCIVLHQLVMKRPPRL